ncbi:MAG: YHS domain-containing protein [bacterium]|nr:YHS domain-containing protein [bacterium]
MNKSVSKRNWILWLLPFGMAAIAWVPLQVSAMDGASSMHHGMKMHEMKNSPGDPYTLSTCPVSGETLGKMGEPAVLEYEGREIRFCCAGCVEKFKADPATYLSKIDQAMIEDQKPFYPLGTCLISGEKLDGKMGPAVDVIYNNRLFRFCCPMCVAKFKQSPGTYWETLNQAVIEKRKEDVSLKTCPVSGEEFGKMGPVQDIVIANRLVRLCCPGCEKQLRENPRKYLDNTASANTGASSAAETADGHASHQHH